jgi:thiol-disulfide isomerase/thioredoxin
MLLIPSLILFALFLVSKQMLFLIFIFSYANLFNIIIAVIARKSKRVIIPVLSVIIILVSVFSMGLYIPNLYTQEIDISRAVNRYIPTNNITIVENTDKEIAQQLEGKITVVECWATWCKPCIKLLPAFEKLSKGNIDTAKVSYITLVSSNIGNESIEKVNIFIKRKEYSFPIYNDSSGIVLDSLGLYSIPTTLITKNGQVERIIIGSSSNETYIQEIKYIVDSLSKQL